MLRRYQPGYADNLLCFILLNLVLIAAYHAFVHKKSLKDVIVLYIAFCVFTFWNTDTAAYKWLFYEHKIWRYKENFYYYLSYICFNSYYLWRLYVWGGATIFFYYAAKNFNLRLPTAFFVLAYFFLLTFSYARVSLAMAVYLYGFSLILNYMNKRKLFYKGCFFILISPLFHRSYYVVVALTPLLFIKLNKKMIVYLIILPPLFFRLIQFMLNFFITSQIELSDNMDDLSESVQNYGTRQGVRHLNWKFWLITMIHRLSYFVSYAYIIYFYYKKSTNALFDKNMKRMIILTTIIFLIASSFLLSGMRNYFHEIVGYRFLYMTSLPIVVVLSYMYQKGIISRKMLYLNLALPLLYSEAWFIGKLLKIPVFW